jgi:DNA-binding transcriptional LysR family regulator
MHDLNDLYYFAEVVAHGGFAQAGRALRQPKSKLSRRIAQLEERLGVRLIERSSRRFRVTEVGQAFYERCRGVLAEAESAEAVAAEMLGTPHGPVRFSCPPGALQIIGPVLPVFLEKYPGVRLQIVATNRPVDLIEEKIDVAMRLRTSLESDASLTRRTLATSTRILVASPRVASGIPPDSDPQMLGGLPTIGMVDTGGEDTWTLLRGSESRAVHLTPRLVCGEISTVRNAAVAGLGVTFLPDHACKADIREGRLVRVLPQWSGLTGTVHLVFTTRRGLPPAVRAFIDHLAAAYREHPLVEVHSSIAVA